MSGRVDDDAAALTPIAGALPSIFVVSVLLILLVAPIYVQGRIDRLHDEIEAVAEPARLLIAEVQYLLARQTAELRGYLLAGDTRHLEQYSRFTARERQIYLELEGYAASLAPEIVAHVVELRTLSEQWHERLEVQRIAGGDTPIEGFEALLAQDVQLRTLEAAGRADLALRGATFDRRQEARDFARLAQFGYFIFLTLAIGATLAVATLNGRIRKLAAEANLRRTEVEAALDETARAIEARADLIRGFTHDVKNPLNAADGYAQLLEAGVRGKLSSEQSATVNSIRNAIRGALEIIEHLLDLSRLESGGLQLRREPVELPVLLREVVAHYRGAATSAGIELSVVEPRGDIPDDVVYADPDRIRQVLDNLVTNAIKYTDAPGSVIIRICAPHAEIPPRPGNWIAIAVSDNGPGIPAEETERIFDEFHRVPGATGRGHGLGLAISRRVARLLGGDVTVRSTLGKGSTFLLWLPVREGQ